MNIFIKSIKNGLAKKIFLPVFFAIFFITVFSFSLLFGINFSVANNFENTTSSLKGQNNALNATNDNNKMLNLQEKSSLPSEYLLYNIKNFIDGFSNENKTQTANIPRKEIGVQSGTSICWAFAVNTALETTIYKKGLAGNESNTLNFSELHMAYTTQCVNRNAKIVGSGNFDLAYEYLSSGYGPVYEQSGEGYDISTNSADWDTNAKVTDFYKNNYNETAVKSPYSVLEAVSFSKKATPLTIEEKESIRPLIKEHIFNNGGVTASIYLDQSHLYFNESYICTDSDTYNQNHMVTLVGWDDDFQLDIGDKSYVGAYIAQNSPKTTNWGIDNGYFYIMYDDAFVENNVNGFSRVELNLENQITYNNLETSEYKTILTLSQLSGTTKCAVKELDPLENFYIANIYQTKNVSNQNLSRIKIPTAYGYTPSNFYVYIYNLTSQEALSQDTIKSFLSTECSQNNFANAIKIRNKYATTEDEYLFSASQTTYYTIEIDQNIPINSEYFGVVVQYKTGSVLQLSNDDEKTYQYTYCSNSLSNWEIYTTKTGTISFMPMIVQTSYTLGTINFEYNSTVTKTYDAENVELSEQIQISPTYNSQIYYSLTGEENDYSLSEPFIKDCKTEDGKTYSSYKVYFKIVADYYQTESGLITITINPKTITLNPITSSKVYGSGYKPIDFENILGCYEPVSTTGRLSYENADNASGENAGSYRITIGTFTLISQGTFNKNNYNLVISSTPVYFTILPRTINVTPSLISVTYGEEEPENFSASNLSVTCENLVNGEEATFSGALIRSDKTNKNAGNYNLMQNTDELNLFRLEDNPAKNFLARNYTLNLTNLENKFVITQRPLYVVPNANQSKIYQEKDPTFTFYFENSVSGEPGYSGKLLREEGEAVGSYNYILDLNEFSLKDNYTFLKDNYTPVLKSVGRFFTITYRELENCSVEDIVTSYTGDYYSLTPYVPSEYTGVEISYSFDNTNWVDNIEVKDVNTETLSYTIFVKFSKQNHKDTIKTATITINPVKLIVTPKENQSKVYGSLDTLLQYSYSGIVNNETPSFYGSLSRTFDLNPKQYERVGTYEINRGNLSLQDNGDFKASNYTLDFNFTNNSQPITFEITPLTLTVTPVELSKYYNTPDPQFTYTFSGQATGETPAYNLSTSLTRESGEEVTILGTKEVKKYKISLGDFTLIESETFVPSNYILEVNKNATFTISPAEITIKVNDKKTYYTQSIDKNFTYSVIQTPSDKGSFKEGDDLKLEYSCNVTDSSLKGLYPITCISNNNNYIVSVQNGTYSIQYYNYLVQFYSYNKVIKTLSKEHFSCLSQEDFPFVETKQGYSFNNWFVVTDEGAYSILTSNYTITSNVNIIAFITTNEYSISYNTNGGEFTPVVNSYNIESPTINLHSPTKQGYTFEGWYLNSNFTGEKITSIPKGSIGDISLYAKYLINTYHISFNSSQQSSYSVVYEGLPDLTYNSSFKFKIMLKTEYSQSQTKMKVYAKLLPDLSKSALETQAEEEENIIELKRNQNNYYVIENVFGNYEIYCEGITLNSYSVFFMADGNIVKQLTKLHGESLNIYEYPLIPEKQNYNNTAPSWNKQGIDSITKDEIILAQYIPNVQKVTLILPNGKSCEVEVNYGEDISIDTIKNNYKLGLFEHFNFNSSLENITENKTIKVTVTNNAYILYIVLASIAVIVTVIVSITLIRKRKRDTFNWWIYTKRK